MVRKYTAITVILLAIQFIRLIFNVNLLLYFILFDTFLLIDFLTVIAIFLLLFSNIGILLKKKWGALLAIVNAIYDIILKFIVFNIYTLIGGFILNGITLVLAFLELRQLHDYNQWVAEQFEQIGYQQLKPPQTNRYCANCGAIIKGKFCIKCGMKVEFQ